MLQNFIRRNIMVLSILYMCGSFILHIFGARAVGYPTTEGTSLQTKEIEYRPGGPSEGVMGVGSMDPSLVSSILKSIVSDETEVRLMMSLLGLEDGKNNGTEVVNQLWNNGNLSEFCLRDLVSYSQDLVKMSKYALQVRSSYATLPNLISLSFTGLLRYDGNYELCTRVVSGVDGAPFDGQYCQVERPLASGRKLGFGICTPDSCNEEDLSVVVNSLLAALGEDVDLSFNCVTSVPWTWGAIFTIFLLSLFGACGFIGTLYDVLSRKSCVSFRRKRGNVTLATTVDKGNHGNQSEETNHNDSPLKDYEQSDRYHENNGKLEGAFEEAHPDQEDASKQQTALNENSSTESCHPAETKPAVKEPPALAAPLDSILKSFSLIENVPKILDTQPKAGTLGALHGVRVLCILWIIWGHCNIYLRYGGLDNVLYVLNVVVSQFWYRATLKAPYAVDTFFMISGLLLTFLTLKHLATTGGKVNWLYFYIHRYCRLTPVYMVSVGVWASLLVHVDEGPYVWDKFQEQSETCAAYWWANLLYISNFFSFPTKQCMSWSWYLANDWQFFLISPLFLVMLSKRKFRKFGVLALFLVTLSSGIITAVVIGRWGFPVGNLLSLYKSGGTASIKVEDQVYTKPWYRIQTYTLGMLVGYVVYRIKDRSYTIPLIKNLIGWTLSTTIMFALIFGLYSSGEDPNLPKWFGAIWHGFDRILFTSCVAWIILACVTGNGGLVNSFLSWGYWMPLSRLTYCCYLLHPMVIKTYLFTKKVTFHWSQSEMIYFFAGSTVISFCLAFCLSLLVESPIVGLLKVLLRKSK